MSLGSSISFTAQLLFASLILVVLPGLSSPRLYTNPSLSAGYSRHYMNAPLPANVLPPPAIREKGRCAGTFLENNTEAVASPWNGLAFPPPSNMATCTEYQNSNVCCTAEQLTALVISLEEAATLLARCPSCFANFKKFFCTINCDPDQSLFVTPIQVFNTSDPNSYLSWVEVTMYTATAQSFYDSCKDTKFASTGGNVMQIFGGATDPISFVSYLAFASGQPPPLGASLTMSINFVETAMSNYTSIPNTTTVGMEFSVDPCSETCSCTDCPAVCPPISAPPTWKDTDVHIGKSRFAPTTVIVFVIGCVVGIAIVITAAILWFTKPVFFVELAEEESEGRQDGKSAHDVRGILYMLNTYYRYHGKFVAQRPFAVILIAFLFIGFSLCWVWRFNIITSPEGLWVPPGSTTATDETYFNDKFGPFWRIEQVILLQKGNSRNNPILTSSNLLLLLQAENDISSMSVSYTDSNGNKQSTTLNDLCYKPIIGQGCLVNSPNNFFQESASNIENPPSIGLYAQPTAAQYIGYCASDGAYLTQCETSIGTPVSPQNVLGGYNDSSYEESTAMVLTYLLNNALTDADNAAALAWETAWINYWKSSSLNNDFDIGYSAERSLGDELNRESNGDYPTIAISYAVMFVYVALALGNVKRPFLVNSRILLALCGIIVVIMSVGISIGLCSLFGVSATLIISEVIPFLVLAIGVDNIFIMVDTFGTMSKKKTIEERLGETLARVGSSITVAAISEGAAFLLGMLTRMPAVTAFAVYACVAIIFNWLLQISFFAALLSLDARRQESGRYDLLPCIKSSAHKTAENGDLQGVELTGTNGEKEIGEGTDDLEDAEQEEAENATPGTPIKIHGYVSLFFDKYYSKFLFFPLTKVIMLLGCVAILMACIGLTQRLQLGLPQQEALPTDSYLVNYFNYLADYGKAGPPMYFVVKGPFNYTQVSQQNLLCSVDGAVGGCAINSLDNSYYVNTRVNTTVFLANTTLTSWLDTYLLWLRPETGCCNQLPNGTFCPVSDTTTLNPSCGACLTDSDFDSIGRPSEETFMKYFNTWLGTICSTACGSCGSVFVNDIQVDTTQPTDSSSYIGDTRFMTYHMNLRDQADYIDALTGAYNFTNTLKNDLGLNVFPYSIFYVFFEQYWYIQSVAKLCIGVALAAIFVVCLVLLGNVYAAVLITIFVGVIQVDVIGVMGLWDIDVNAVSVVNLVMAIGIAVEFSVHIVHKFISVEGSRAHRAKLALVETGSSVLRGITLTKAVGVIVLAFAHGQIFQIYYFRMFFSLVVLAAFHCLIVLPIVLSLIGPRPRRRPCELY